MLELKGKYNMAKVFTNNIEEAAIQQITTLCSQNWIKDSKIRIMPDVHAGAGCTIGTTMTILDKICPNLVGVDIGCGMLWGYMPISFDLKELDKAIRQSIPAGKNIHTTPTHIYGYVSYLLKNLKCADKVDIDYACRSVGTLGGGNHFIEVDIDSKGRNILVIHTGSRHLGVEVCKYYQNLAVKNNKDNPKKELIQELKTQHREREIQTELKKLKENAIPNELAYLKGQDAADYLDDMKIVQHFASFNRCVIMNEILRYFKILYENISIFETIHNYVDFHTTPYILRKGAVRANLNEQLLIPLNMRDGSLICIGKGNADWNFSAPHGAGRIMSRGQAKKELSLEKYQHEMEGIFSTSVNMETIDESPMAYKDAEEIKNNILDTVEIVEQIKPIYNFKAGEN